MWPEVSIAYSQCPHASVWRQDEKWLIHHPSWLCRQLSGCGTRPLLASNIQDAAPLFWSHTLNLITCSSFSGVSDGVDPKTNPPHQEKERQISIREELEEKAADCKKKKKKSEAPKKIVRLRRNKLTSQRWLLRSRCFARN